MTIPIGNQSTKWTDQYLPVSRLQLDVQRIGKFLGSQAGEIFIGNQKLMGTFQTYNPDYDPLQNEVEPEPPAEQREQPNQAIDTRRNSILSQERFVTPTQAENTGTQRLLKHHIHVDPHMTPAAQWVLFLINSYQYEVMMKPNGADNIEKLGKTGRVGTPIETK